MDKGWLVAGILGLILVLVLVGETIYRVQVHTRLEELQRECQDTNVQLFAMQMKYKDLNYIYNDVLGELEACRSENNLLSEFLWKFRDLYVAHVHLMYIATLSDYGDLNCDAYIPIHGVYIAVINDFLDFMRKHKNELIAAGQFTEETYYQALSEIESLRSVADTIYSECLSG